MNKIELARTLGAFLGEQPTLSLATVDEAGFAHAANVYFAPDGDLNLYFVSHPSSAHSRHMERHSHVAATVYEPVSMWQRIRGVQLHGHAMPIDPGDFAPVWKIYLEKFPHIQEIESTVRAQQFYVIDPTWFRWIDNAVKFGFRIETEWPMA
ncbi:MAG: hypothetical protein GVY28_07055 [Alphaproteobacteria bacterium]|jgi:uncharacterized protein YhbP (UPF0306 family)|nr:hypothetical protein [Alphaproteobacteria bacterium]